MIELVNSNDLEELMKDGLVLLDFNATWCGPCRQLKPLLEELSSKIKIISIDVDNHEELSKKYGIMSIPNLKLCKDGQIIKEQIGYINKEELEEFITIKE